MPEPGPEPQAARGLAWFWKVAFGLSAYSIAVLLLAGILHLADGGVLFKGYLHKINWAPFFLFWFAVLPLVHATWEPFQRAWRESAKTGVLHSRRQEFVPGNVLDALLASIQAKRLWLACAAGVLALGLNYLDVRSLLACYGDRNQCDWSHLDFSVAWLVLGDEFRTENAVFVVLAYAQQLVLVFFAWLALLQLLFHSLLPAFVGRFRVARDKGLLVTLNHRSALHEFGMENWNYALNNAYWLISAGLIVALLSRYAQAPDVPISTGQLLIRCTVPFIVLGPMIATIVVRQRLLRDVWHRLDVNEPTEVQLFHAQMIWPLDRNWSSKLGLIVAFGLLSYLIGVAPFDKLLAGM